MNTYMQQFIEIAGKIGAQRHLTAIRDGFVAVMPLVIIGSLAVLINNFPPLGRFHLAAWLNAIFGEGNWQKVGGNIWEGTFAILGLLVSFTISYHLAKSYNIDRLPAALLSGASYIILVPVTADFGLDMDWLGTQGLFVGIIIALLTTELFRIFLINPKLIIKMPEDVPAGVTNSFKSLIPIMLVLFIVGLCQSLLSILADTNIFEIIFTAIQQPIQGLGDSLPAAILVALLTHVLWFFGLHGTNITGAITEPIYISLVEENLRLFGMGMSAYDVPNIVTKPFLDAFVFMGGAGTTIALLAAVFIVIRTQKNHPYRQVAKLSAPGSMFNINEPVIFGLPIVLNPIMLIPFVLVPVTLTIISYMAMFLGIVPKTVAMLPWTTPPILSGYLVTGGSWRGVALQICNLLIAIIIYIPFLLAALSAAKQQERVEEV
ncbi:PTS sugar transporter subunit IIC [Gracilibacillus alcaliphilus]|uniref:PTS sugar transporter subunit IIC n=1 Tax=Gracilibacillus alcaliphilus TaxID=1401441 RepID=UPI001EF94A1B|nr:PTS sugar transporter subunit IIC [Gracilibacillus alcaliphilus]MBM7675509.1 PTS system cellobiose-specific IIC component [Gracilibacillus alcaliphilus]